MTTTALLFDLGEVLMPWNYHRLMDKCFEVTGLPDTQETRDLVYEWNSRWDGCHIGRDCGTQKAARPDLAPLIDAYIEHFDVSLSDPVMGTVDVMREAKARGLKMYTASNWAADTFEIAKRRMTPFLDLFDDLFISGYEGVIKPHAAYFEKLLAKFSLAPNEALFIDDRQVNIDGAMAVGIPSILFTSPEQLRASLKAQGVL